MISTYGGQGGGSGHLGGGGHCTGGGGLKKIKKLVKIVQNLSKNKS